MTEVLDVAPIDAIYSLSKEAMAFFGALDFIPPHIRDQAIDLKMHWVSETGKDPIRLTGGMRILPTVSIEAKDGPCKKYTFSSTKTRETQNR